MPDRRQLQAACRVNSRELPIIRHTVSFTLRHPQGSEKEIAFLRDALALADTPSVCKFERLRQVSAKNAHHFGFSMEFDDQAGYDACNIHPIHEAFVRDRWAPEVVDFLETDYVRFSG